ncbi:hypothetical protein OTU49_016650 [Cherax quadricarinatus]|uniref:Non-homologous end-joining factor 1 n=1 Tax=Cherax quadricarinatus TaxID=27406 RepID=A0AAW0Y677_CHEQU
MASLKIWRAIEESPWGALPSMGPQWMIKSCTNNQGYLAMVTDGCGLWGEKRNAKYILEQAEVWSPCLESGSKEISDLALAELTKPSVKAVWTDNRESVTLSISSELHGFSYRWEFELKRLSDELFNHHWVTPMLVQVQQLASRVNQLTTEVEHKRRQLDELLPDNKSPAKSSKTTKNKDNLIESSAEVVLVNGAWAVLQDHLTHYPQIMSHLTKMRTQASEKVTNVSALSSEKNLLVASNKRNQNSSRTLESETQAEREEREAKEQRERRANIQRITQGTAIPATQTKKKKKLNI